MKKNYDHQDTINTLFHPLSRIEIFHQLEAIPQSLIVVVQMYHTEYPKNSTAIANCRFFDSGSQTPDLEIRFQQ